MIKRIILFPIASIILIIGMIEMLINDEYLNDNFGLTIFNIGWILIYDPDKIMKMLFLKLIKY